MKLTDQSSHQVGLWQFIDIRANLISGHSEGLDIDINLNHRVRFGDDIPSCLR